MDDLFGKLTGPKRDAKKDRSKPSTGDLLGKLTDDTPDSRKTDKAESTAENGEKSTGLTSLDMLSLPADQRKVINWLTRNRQASFVEIQNALEFDTTQLEACLTALKKENYIHDALIDGKVIFRVVFRGPA